jgi:N-acetylglutamate synthase and related acetyltransferases
MEIRQATTADSDPLRRVARRSLRSSYGFIDGDHIEAAIENWYGEAALSATLTDTGDVVLVAEEDGQVLAFSQSAVLGETDTVGEVRWLHVDPDHRDRGVGSELLERTEEVLQSQGVDRVRGVVLQGNESGAHFYQGHGFERVDERPVAVGDETYTELILETGPDVGRDAADYERVAVDGESAYAYLDEGDRGSSGPFHPVYRTRDRDDLLAWYCGACGAVDNAMDPMGRLECNDCGNTRKPTRWDAAYL